MIDFDAYLRRIGLDPADKPAWQAVHRAHVTTIPFENLNPHRGIPVSLEQADLERKLVASRRGGYCFEHNLLLASALAHMGLEVEPMLARARVGGAPRETRPATHLVLRVTGAGRQWQADVGFGLGTLLDPIPFGPAGVHEQSGWSFQVVEDGDELTLQTLGTNGWADVYSFPPRPAFRIDIEVSNWWTCTDPAHLPGGRVRPARGLTTDDNIAVQAFAAAGLGVAVIPGLAAAHSLPHVEVQPIRGSAPVRRLWAARPHDPFCPRPARAMIDTVKLTAKPRAADRGP